MKRIPKPIRTVMKLVALAALVAGGVWLYGRYNPVEEEAGIGELPRSVAQVRDITVSVQATGVLRPVTVVEVKSKASGEIIEMPVELGDRVNAGDLIVQVDTEILRQELKQAQADLEAAEVRLRIAKRQFERAQDLQGQGVISQNDLETSEQNYTTAEAALLRADAATELARERLNDATVRAPITGTIIEKTVEEGQIIASSMSNVSGGTTLVRMADLSQLEIRTLVDEIDIGVVKPDLPVESRVEAFPDMKFEGEVIKIEPAAVVEQSVTTFPVLSRIDNSSGLLLPGMNADVSIIIHRRPDVLAVPSEVVRTLEDAREVSRLLMLEPREGGRARRAARGGNGPDGEEAAASRSNGEDAKSDASMVFVLDESGRVVPKRIVAGVRGWDFTEVVEGLEAGDEVVTLPSASLLRSQESLRERYSRRSGIPGMGGRSRR